LPSTSNTDAPTPRSMKTGVPPTALNARTGEFTPPGNSACARSNRLADRARLLPGLVAIGLPGSYH
jgi:hypothetical protein